MASRSDDSKVLTWAHKRGVRMASRKDDSRAVMWAHRKGVRMASSWDDSRVLMLADEKADGKDARTASKSVDSRVLM